MEHVLFFQFGDFAADYRRFLEGGEERYRDQWLSLKIVEDLSREFRVTNLVICDRPHREEFSPTLCSIGIDIKTAHSALGLLPLLERLAPDRLILRMPHRTTLLWARLRGITTLPVFADIFAQGGWRQDLENRLVRWGLSGQNVACVSNHSLNASLSLNTILKLDGERIVPWDRPHLNVAPDPKSPPATDRPLRAFYAGHITESKGIGDCLQAAALLDDLGLEIDFAGSGDLAAWEAKAAQIGVSHRVRFLGGVPNAEVRSRMRDADLVLVPSRHDYAEGLPNTLCEALAARVPTVISDHPAFASRLENEQDCLIFRASDPVDMANQIRRLAADPDLQIRLSQRAPAALASLRYGLDWFTLIRKFINDPKGTNGWISRNNLTRLEASRKASNRVLK